ncbi:DUF397 domain-containing protein [Streptomyces thermodiastaticus]|uniref:DUF397 domain-containing protein n=1 Tax=Streptomyces thermodiastaticus TaxID=44061 RepID=UPI00167648C8|nr:DUF397 domain-containing protein [Streptomyces thermodiastaticus]MCE7552271.1 DUF397 domain-containing protein [Streptomyces thermodiastaticus]GHF90761.1 DUF397 domain-containing protein [Streptomyces thermodiastaticus]
MPKLHWRKSSHSGDSTSCVEVAATPTAIHIRDSKAPATPHLTVAPSAWAEFLSYAAEAGA